MKKITLFMSTVAIAMAAGAGFFMWAERHPALSPIEPPDRDMLDHALVEQGQMLAAAGYCSSCHTTSSSEPYSGGRATQTPFGVVYATNISPDPENGIGTWSEEAFRRAMHEGIRKDGAYLYPAFPYDHFTLITDEDISALYAYFMAQEPIPSQPLENELGFPFNIRTLLAGWNLLYFEPGRFEADPEQDDDWNRGGYLVEALGHCGACHTPRNALGGPKLGERFAGARVDGWYATGIGAHSPSPLQWSEWGMVNYLIDGWDRDHGVAAGPMTPVVNHLALLPEDDIYAMAVYITSFQEDDDRDRDAILAFAEEREFESQTIPESDFLDDPALRRGQERFASSCADCHRRVSETAPLALASSVSGPDPINLINVTIDGIRPPDGVPEKSMPRFTTMSDEELHDLVSFIRHHFTEEPAWDNIKSAISIARENFSRSSGR